MDYKPEIAVFEGWHGFNDALIDTHYSVTRSGSYPTILPTGNRRGGPAIAWTGLTDGYKPLPASHNNSSQCTFGFNVKINTANASNAIFSIYNVSGGTLFTLAYNTTTTLSGWRNGNSGLGLGTTAELLNMDTNNYVECAVGIGPTAGFLYIRLNGSTIATVASSNISTNSSSITIFGYQFSNATGAGRMFTISDFYYCNTLSFLGDCRVDEYPLTGDGTGTLSLSTNPSTTTHYVNVGDTTLNTVNYNYGTTGQDSYLKTAMSHTPLAIYAAKQVWYAQKDDAGPKYISGYMRKDGVDYTPGAGQALATSPRIIEEYILSDPSSTGQAFSKTGFDALELGPKIS